MSGFKALNIESDDESEIEVDDTKELQIEDALKLYQTALRYHAEGAATFDKAAEAYQELFESEIFRYPESQAELQRIALYGAFTDDEQPWMDEVPVGTTVAKSSFDSGPSTLPQILHLSHKNYAQFRLDHLTARLDTVTVTLQQIVADASEALSHFVDALDKDDTDLDLWRKTAAVGGMLNSKRVARFCLEAVLEGDDEGLNGVLSLPGLEDGLAGEQLRDLIVELDDRLSMLQSPLSTGKRRVLSRMLKQRLNVFEDILQREEQLIAEEGLSRWTWQQPERITLKLGAEQRGTGSAAPATALAFDLSGASQSGPGIVEDHSQMIHPNGGMSSLPTTIAEQFPGLDAGKPTTQPQIASAHPSTQLPGAASGTITSPTMTLVTRKRSAEAAGMADNTEEGRTKSKRTRARESNVEPADNRQAQIDANTRWEHEQQLNEFQAADDWMFETVGNMFERIGVVGFGKAREVRHDIGGEPDDHATANFTDEPQKDGFQHAQADIVDFLTNYNDQLAHLVLQKDEDSELASGATAAGLGGSLDNTVSVKASLKAPPMPHDRLPHLLACINRSWMLPHEVVNETLMELLSPGSSNGEASSYAQFQWSEKLKEKVVQMLVNYDDTFYTRVRDDLTALARSMRAGFDKTRSKKSSPDVHSQGDMLQTIFELHLDIYKSIKRPGSLVKSGVIVLQGDRLQRWADLARDSMYLRQFTRGDGDGKVELNLRFLWAMTLTVTVAEDVLQEHVIECMHDLRRVCVDWDLQPIQLQNNAVMPELSVAALDREIARVTTRDFFLKVTSQDSSEPVAVIESLEPLLDSLDNDGITLRDDSDMDIDEGHLPVNNVSPELVRYVQSTDMGVRLLLWQRLREAYSAIDYQPMVVSCYLRMMRMLLSELRSSATASLPQQERQAVVFKIFRLLKNITHKVLSITQQSDDAFSCIDQTQLKVAVSTFGELLQLVQVFNICDDSRRVGRTQPPTLAKGLPVPTFAAVNKTVHELQLQIWMILYALLKEAIYQNSDLYPTFVEDKFDFLRCVHRNLGLRGICGGLNRVFVRLLKDEFQNMMHIDGYESEQAQVLYDLYGLNCFLNPAYELIEHHCTHDAFLDRGAAMSAVDLLLTQASKLSIRELVKHSLRDTIEKVHGAVVRRKPSEAIMRNREIYRAFMRSPINPLDILYSLQGDGNGLPVSTIPKEDALLASKGWYFLMGHLSLTKYRSLKRTAPTPTEDVEIAIAFFMQDLEYSMDNWETWFRLAQAYDTKIEESVVWSAEKLNNSLQEIVQHQRAAIHCYTMATALMHRSAALAFETSGKMTELYADFAARLYSSSREPFSMLPFAMDDEKFMSMPTGVGKSKLFEPLRLYTAWKLAKALYQRAIAGKPQSWTLRFALGKCLWKMHIAPRHIRRNDRQSSAEDVLEPFIRAIELLPDLKDSREKREPTLEPHYKLVSIVHKLVERDELSLEQACEFLQHTRYAHLKNYPHSIDAWNPHVLAILKNLRAADKSNWHHRMIARAAHIIYGDAEPRAGGLDPTELQGVVDAKQELTQQMFTKTMVLQVWRPECERAGRHFVYTARYTRFFTQILEQLEDRPSLEALARRVRRRPHDMFEHGVVWQEICNAYLRLLRKHADLSEGLETSTFSNIAHEDFLARKEPLERWMQMQDSEMSAALDVLREVQELKKINQSLMKPGPIDDLIGDAYAYLFVSMGKQLWDEERKVKLEEEARRPPPPATNPPRNPMMSLTNLMNLDGISDAATAASTPVPQPEHPAQPRKKTGVGRREIRTCAEACTQKSAAPPTARTLAASNTRVQVVITPLRGAMGDVSGVESATASIHDSADDESELSELEEDGGEVEEREEGGEEVVGRLLFPGLVSAVETAEASPRSGIGEGVDGEEGDIIMDAREDGVGAGLGADE
ncbi:Histone transcription regulator 3 [Friedmanniomyces endolithicus]|nr:Histone transcription regulator 3 [Friedmanniomyces endolithicus]KAK0778163.1 Histone transcription regulator 3 [Friedmanniomyces endolithicus]KAK0784279.1 Histone transcription regulator 3 [Friedmanniomyces endolithicus]KAK0796777.1 Histone transcription regulator 3 [Friedmanniomyces endolithicus]KAK0902675.1 Histone transcription regulator 3 [Friedmanniomyces endolithicus]